jgi:hypothetical protein
VRTSAKIALGLGGTAAGFLLLARRRRTPPPSAVRERVGGQLLVGDAAPPPRPVVGARQGDQEGLVVLRPGETRYLPCTGLVAGHVVLVLPPGDYEACQRNLGRPGAGLAELVDIDPREHEAVVSWMVVRGGHLELAARDVGNLDRELVAHVIASNPQTRFVRF